MRWPGGPTSRPAALANEVEEVHMPKQPLPKPRRGRILSSRRRP